MEGIKWNKYFNVDMVVTVFLENNICGTWYIRIIFDTINVIALNTFKLTVIALNLINFIAINAIVYATYVTVTATLILIVIIHYMSNIEYLI